MSYVERQREWAKENNIQVGDKVKVVRKARDYEDGWGTCWVEEMDGMVGGVFEIIETNQEEDCGLDLASEDPLMVSYLFPYFCLEPIAQSEEIEKPKDNDMLREEKNEKELELIHDTIYHLTCHRSGDEKSEWIYRYDSSRMERASCNGSYEVYSEYEDKYGAGGGFVADEDEIESIRIATIEEVEAFLEAEYKCIEKDLVGADYSIVDNTASDSLEFGYNKPKNKYSREIFPNVFIDVYDVLRAFKVEDGALQHLIKKALADGQRGHKDQMQDRIDIRDSAESAIRNLEIKIKIEENE